MREPLRKTDPDYDAIRSRAFGYAIQRGRFTPSFVDEAIEAGRAELKHDRLLAEFKPCAHCLEPTQKGRWCSDACRIAEDGPQPDEIPEEAAA